MHGVENTFHGFVELSPDCYLAFVQHPENSPDIQFGVSHAENAGSPVTRGTMQHLAFGVDTLEELYEMRDRIRGNGVQVMGPIDHGFIQSIFYGFGAAGGFALVLVLFAAMRERLQAADVPRAFRGTAIALITAGIMSLAFMGFSGMARL